MPNAPRPQRNVLWVALPLVAGFMAFAAIAEVAIGAGPSDLNQFFWPAAELAAHGHPLLLYSLHAGVLPNNNGPVSYIPLSLVALLANALGWGTATVSHDALTMAIFAVFGVLMAREAVQIIDHTRGPGDRPLLLYAAFLLAPALWVALASYGHVEEPIELWLTLLAVRLLLTRRTIGAGVVLGLVILTRSAAAIALVTLALATLGDAGLPTPRRRMVAAATLLGTAALTACLGLLPFLLADRHDLVYSMLTYRGALPIAGGSIWVLLARGLPWASLVQHGDTIIFTAAAMGLVAFALRRARDRRLTPATVCGLLAIASLCVPLLAKTTWGYYLLDPYVFATICSLSQPSTTRPWRRAAVPATLTVLTVILAKSGLAATPTPGQVALGVGTGVCLLGCLALLLHDWLAHAATLLPATLQITRDTAS